MNPNYLDFEQPIAELEVKIEELQLVGSDNDLNISEEITTLREKSTKLTEKIYSNLSSWDIVKVARHPQRPYSLDYIPLLFTEFDELHGDRSFGDDSAIVGGLARLDGEPVMVIGQEKGRSVQDKVARNFGMPRPEGYRKALRLMELAERFSLPVITLIDTPGAYPGIDSEERGISEAIAQNLAVMSRLRTPIICVVIGEGSSGGALGIGVGDHLAMLQYATYFVISPGGLRQHHLEDLREGARRRRGHGCHLQCAAGTGYRRCDDRGTIGWCPPGPGRNGAPHPGTPGRAVSRAQADAAGRDARETLPAVAVLRQLILRDLCPTPRNSPRNHSSTRSLRIATARAGGLRSAAGSIHPCCSTW